ncbi:MAG TPA: response regulator [Pyrinomonadaceae bacterium]|nr:response regulator [Pyrinomonadaceae bacterium]
MSRRILIVDDEEHIRRMIRITLEAGGYEVAEAADGQTGLELYGDGLSWDLVLLDQRMPGMDGLETLSKIKQVDPGARVIMATAYASIELAVDAMKLGASDFVRKPMTPEVLRNAVVAALKKSRTTFVRDDSGERTQSDSSALRIQTITMNGFTILDPEPDDWKLSGERRFTVVSPSGTRHDILVEIEGDVVGYVERLTHRRLSSESSFWTEAARRLLGDYLWNNGNVPPMRKLTLTQISRDKLQIAERWRE